MTPPRVDWDDLVALFPDLPDPERWLPLLQRHAGLIEAAAGVVRVSAVAPGEAVRRQYAESLELVRVAGGAPAMGTVADVGSGGGFPGLVFAVLLPESEVHLIEPLQKRARFLSDCADAMGLTNVHVHGVRAEEAGRGVLRDSCDLVTARAVAALPELIELTAPLARPGGRILLPKGSGAPEEVVAAGFAASELSCEQEPQVPFRDVVSEYITCVVLRKTAPTNSRYPRRPGIPAKRPLR